MGFPSLPTALQRVRDQVKRDIAADPYLTYILGLSLLFTTFFIWHRIPNFATRDERWRVVDAMEIAGFLDTDLSFEALQSGAAFWRPFGPTLYLYGALSLPVFIITFLTGETGVFADMLTAMGTDSYAHWQAIPEWILWATILPARLSNVLFAVASVYVVYRIGTTLRDRATGRLAALLHALTWSVIVLAHEAGEDVPAMLFTLVALYLAIRYVETGARHHFLWGSAVGGLAIAFKPTAGIVAIVLGVAYLLRLRRGTDDPLVRPVLLVGGPLLALAVIYVSFPSVVLNGPEVMVDRLARFTEEKSESHGWLDSPTWWWFLRGWLHGFGWPLFLACVGSVMAAIPRLREDSLERDGVVLALVGIGVVVAVYSRWAYFHTHHLFLTFPLGVLLTAIALQRLAVERRQLARGLMAGLVLTTALYAGVGTVGYATQPRDQAVGWVTADAGPNATVETYSLDSQEAAVPHHLTIYRPTKYVGDDGPTRKEWLQDIEHRCPDYVVLNYQLSFIYLAPDNHSQLSDDWTWDGDAEHIETLLSPDAPPKTDTGPYPYTVKKRFGREPFYLDDGEPIDPTWNLIRAGIYPRTIEYGDPQDFGVYQYVVILERNGTCTPPT